MWAAEYVGLFGVHAICCLFAFRAVEKKVKTWKKGLWLSTWQLRNIQMAHIDQTLSRLPPAPFDMIVSKQNGTS